ncbi:restriction endonuclease [Leptolyngbya sp. PCC 7375]|nr:restriction endonuclease [Leptolyngbya sp. PCC 7375]
MPRRKSFSSILKAAARESARAQRRAVAAQKQKAREHARAVREAEKQAKQEYLEQRLEKVEEINSEIAEWIQELNEIIEHTLKVNDTISFDELRVKETFPEIQIPQELESKTPTPILNKPSPPPKWLTNILPCIKQRYINSVKKIDLAYQAAKKNYRKIEQERIAKLEKYKTDYEKGKQAFAAKVKQRNADVDELEKAYRTGDSSAVATYNEMVLERSEYPSIQEYASLFLEYGYITSFPQNFRVAYVSDSKQLVIDYELPNTSIIPPIAEVRYVKTKDEIKSKARKATELKTLYQDVISAIALRCVHEIWEADQANLIEVVVFSGYVNTVDRAVGKDIQPYLISLRVIKDRFSELDLARVDKRLCLKNLGAQLSPRPTEMQAIKPIVNFEMVDPRFIEQEGDILSDLESRPNLLELSPSEFESFVASLFTQMGFETKLTRSSRDGGVDSIAFDTRPIVGGKVVIQAKRYRNTVGVSAVRDLYGTMMNEGANKGILVATSGYGPDAYDFAKDKPIELVDGSGLLYLLDSWFAQNREGLKSYPVSAR